MMFEACDSHYERDKQLQAELKFVFNSIANICTQTRVYSLLMWRMDC